MPVVTSRGCPYNCQYCSVTALFGHQYRYRSAEKVIGDIRTALRPGLPPGLPLRRQFHGGPRAGADDSGGVRELGITWNAQARLDFHWKDPPDATIATGASST